MLQRWKDFLSDETSWLRFANQLVIFIFQFFLAIPFNWFLSELMIANFAAKSL